MWAPDADHAPLSIVLLLVIRGLVDVLCGAPLLFAPARVLASLGWTTPDPLLATLLGTFLVALGATSIVMGRRRDDADAVRRGVMQRLVLDTAAALAYTIVLARGDQGGPWIGAALLTINCLSIVAALLYLFTFHFEFRTRASEPF